ncbi:hypothetical protein [Nocardioides jiangxiensis]|uniref:Uncharacterized protein n=1 Tax=Nocardioides jiangxiensis TaxID=3064524 RepID=A0ABT9B5L4_9ACTN|nr:hypothetical protein [Nocardioides sp. WY-20]MDO7869594.1 hypothetical protein [Nocardioides sp. WY-20]
MSPSSNDPSTWESVSRTIREASPHVPQFTSAEKSALWQRIEVHAAATPRRRRPPRVVVAGTLAAFAIGGAGVATAAVYSAHTGIGPVDAEDVELGGPGERLDPSAPDFAVVLDEITRDIRFPSNQARERSLAFEADDLAESRGPSVSAGALRLWMSGHALCSWTDQWAVALRSGDDEARGEAAKVVLSARTWPSITDTDPEMANESEFAWLPALEQAIEAQRPQAAREALFSNGSCLPAGLASPGGIGVRR